MFHVHNDDEVRALFMLFSNSSNWYIHILSIPIFHFSLIFINLVSILIFIMSDTVKVGSFFLFAFYSPTVCNFASFIIVFKPSDSEEDMEVSSGRHARHYTRYAWALETAFFPQLCGLV
ncbi:hypothetical protein S245_005095 [Arachis hypogaea]|nr:uncharacterized protein DS421_2g49720 [Arachis hypogaea]